MAILVDELREYPGVALPFTVWCHMATDGSFDELHEFAARLGLRRAWFQRDHYDLPAHGRAAAVALGAEEVATGELLLRMAGARGERARRRVLAPAGVVWLRGPEGPAVLRYRAGALVVVGGPPGAGKSALAARVADRAPVLGRDDADADLRTTLAAGRGAVAVTTARRVGLARAAGAAGFPAHLLMLHAGGGQRIPDGRLAREWEAYGRALEAKPDPRPFASVTILDREAADRLRRVDLHTPSRA